MTELDGVLGELSRLRSGSEPIVSLYLDVRWNDEKKREQVRLFVQERARHTLAHYLPESPGREPLARTLQRVQDFAAGLAGQAFEADKNGVALFASETLGLWRSLFFHRAFQDELCFDAIPHLTQLVRIADDFEPAIVAVPSPAGADIYHVSLGALAVEANLRGFVPRREEDEFNPGAAMHGRHFERVEKDGRHQDAYVQRNRRAATTEVTALFDQRPGSLVVLVGTSENVSAFERELPGRVQAQVIARVPRPREWESGDGPRRDGVVAGAAAAVAVHEQEVEARLVQEVIGQSLRGGLAVAGPEDVVLAANEGRIRCLVVEEDFHRVGWRCENCEALGTTETDEVCPWCGGELRVVKDLREALVARSIAEGAEVEIVAHTNKLHSYAGVGALLRQSTPTGLRGESLPWPTEPGAGRG